MSLVVFPSKGAPIPLGVLLYLEGVMSLVAKLFLGMSMFLGSILFLGPSIPLVMFGNKGEATFLGDHHIKKDILTLLIHIWGVHMVHMV